MKKLFTLVAAVLFATNMSAQKVAIIDNGELDLEGDFSNFVIKEEGINENTPMPADEFANYEGAQSGVLEGEGPDGANCIKCHAPAKKQDGGQAWDSQFWIVFSEPLFAPTSVSVSFDYKASAAASVDTQSHYTPGNYHIWYAIGTIGFTDEWQTYEKDFDIDSSMEGADGMLSIAFNLTMDQDMDYYFANFTAKAKIIVLSDPEWINVLANGKCEEGYEACVYPITVTDGALDVHSMTANGTGLGSGIADGAFYVESKPDAANAWDSQFWMVAPRALEAGNRVKFAFEYRADAEATVSTQAHAAPGTYNHYDIGIGNLSFTTEWQYKEKEVTLTADQAKADNGGFQSVAFNLNEDKTLQTKFYFDNMQLFFDDSDDGYATGDDEEWAAEVESKWATGVKSVKTQKAQKAIYNLAGQQVDKNYKGIVIENGQKRINK
jgi:hypothetical protein